MEKLIFNRPLTRTSYLEKLFWEFGVSLLVAEEHFTKNQNTLKNLTNILDSNDEENMRECFALLHILTHRNSYGMIKKYCAYNNKPEILNDPGYNLLVQITQFTKKYKLDLLSALLYDDAFYNKTREWYQKISDWSGKIEEKPSVNEEHKIIQFKLISENDKPIERKSDTDKLAASPSPDDAGDRRIHRFTATVNFDSYSGDLIFVEDNRSRYLEVEFAFLDNETKASIDSIPANLSKIEVDLVSYADNKRRTVTLDRPMLTEATLCSKPIDDIDFSAGYKPDGIRGFYRHSE